MNEKAYLVIAGEYSDRHEVALFCTREEAEDFVEVYNRQRGEYCYGEASIKEMEFGIRADYKNEFPFEVRFDKDGTLSCKDVYYEACKPRSIEEIDYLLPEIPQVIEQTPFPNNNEITGYLVVVFAKDFASAVKKASDILAEHRAMKEGVC